MPIYEYYNDETNTVIEKLFKYEERPKEIVYEGNIYRLILSMPARTEYIWGKVDGGVNGTFNRGLGVRVRNPIERDKIAKQKGLIPLDHLTSNQDAYIQDMCDHQDNAKAKAKAQVKEYKEALKASGGDDNKALEKILPAKKILNGDL